MRNKPTSFWGKLRRNEDGLICDWHPLFDHCADVAAVVETLLALPTWRKRLARLAGRDLSDTGWRRLCVLAALHDLGKLNLGFQAKGRSDLGPTAGHVCEALGAIFRPEIASCLGEIAAWGEGTTGLLISSICHHGRPQKNGEWQSVWWQPRGGLDPVVGAAELLQKCRVWFPAAFDNGGALLPENPALEHAFAGLVMLADWLGSDTRFFPFSREGEPDRIHFARRAARQAAAEMALDMDLSARADAEQRSPFHRVAPVGFLPRPAQEAVVALPLDNEGSITILESETGSGKTEAALARFADLFSEGLVDGLYFALPTRTAATQIHNRVHAAVQRAFNKPPAVILAVPGYLRVDDVEGRKLPAFEVLWPDRDRFRYRAWAAETPKRYLAGCVVVGTIDQVLLSSLMVGHAHLRAVSLLRHLLVVDEVHASDAYMARILQDVLCRHRAAGGHALLLSATLGAEARCRLLHPEKPVAPPAVVEAENTPYPLVSHRAEGERIFAIRNDARGRVVEIESQPWLEDATALGKRALDAAMRGAKVLVIKNTVADCIETQLAIERAAESRNAREVLFTCADAVAPHHARFARKDREALDSALEARFGKDRADGGCVVVATQTVQQSLDLDADVLFTDLCPADVLLQRIGRLHRHQRRRPEGFVTPRAIVIVPACRDLGVLLNERGEARHHHGLGTVYPDLRILEATWRLVEAETAWRIPEMNRRLVERSVHSQALASIADEGRDTWIQHSNAMIGNQRGQSRQGELNLVDWSKPYSDMSFPDDLDQRITTRLGEGDRRVRFDPSFVSPFGHEVGEIVIRASWSRGVPADCDLAHEVVSTTGVTRFEFGTKPFIYDRLGLRPAAEGQREVADDDGP